ncbi:amidohydrolase family protein [Pseudomaricurvus alkylphenolicus]|uniref:amidohydrolase n=1 Tax=Pseudomaricurvus alkylphenolicus TaxID=1306991 RepID=UPI0014229FFB|nr:amidohydrolase family protein [Pseudomaricurvus alkylphenolicus]NIB37988.1 amidohydrolase family protein [Pseudomaricurvus alkylphenolicus]
MLIRQAEIAPETELQDVLIRNGKVVAIAPTLLVEEKVPTLEARERALLPGLHDHHIHLLSLAASLQSLDITRCKINQEREFTRQLQAENTRNSGEWLRVVGYHHSLAGDIDRYWLDQWIPDRPVKVQQRGGRLWILNSKALEILGESKLVTAGASVERVNHEPTGRLYELDAWLRAQLPNKPPELSEVSRILASYGVTGLTDTTPSNGPDNWAYFAKCQQQGDLLQRVRVMGGPQLSHQVDSDWLTRGELKIHLLESQLPDFYELCDRIEKAHRDNRNVAIHCVTRVELIFSLEALQQAGAKPGDRIEHASVTPPQQLQQIRELGLRVVTQPHFIGERGDQYRVDVEPDDQPWLYRCRGFLSAGVPLAGGSDAPFGTPNPWLSMHHAVNRCTPDGHTLGEHEVLTPEQALQLFTSELHAPGVQSTAVRVGANADLCLLDRNWHSARKALNEVKVTTTIVDGNVIFDSMALA